MWRTFGKCLEPLPLKRLYRSPRTRDKSVTIQPVSLGYLEHGRNTSFMQLFHKLRLSHGPDPVESPRLTPQMVTSILRMNEKSMKVDDPTASVVKEVQINQLQANKPIEDRHVEGRLAGTHRYLFAVYDGHAGCACAQTLKDRLFHYVAVSMADPEQLNRLYQEDATTSDSLIDHLATSKLEDISPDLASLHWQSLLHFVNDSIDMYSLDSTVQEALTNAFLRMDQDISSEASSQATDPGLKDDVINIALSGAVGCVAFIDGLDLYIANVGDCQAVLGSHSSDSGLWEATVLSNKHDAENEGEVRRLFSKHPNESSNILKGGRLFGELMPLRAFGDMRYKWDKKHLEEIISLAAQKTGSPLSSYKRIQVPNSYRTPPYLDSEPEITHYRLSPKDRFLVVASDGLWDSEGMTVDKVVSLVGHHTEGQQVLSLFKPPEGAPLSVINDTLRKRKQDLAKRSVDKNAATHLVRHALGLEHGQLSAQLTLPEKLVRYYRDDITITVIYFDQDYMMHSMRKH